ncbi:MAG: hypothetical protein CL681_26225 [Blastopirellula sp.]|nr:hypothetical protein [Blastopirellula sp.]
MNFNQLVNDLFSGTKSDVNLFLPEVILCVTMVVMLLIRLPKLEDQLPMWIVGWLVKGVALAGTLVAFGLAAVALYNVENVEATEIFTGMLVYGGFTIFMRTILIGFAVLFVCMTCLSGIPDHEDGPDIYTLVLGATLGMCLMVSANHLLTIFLAVEMASVPSYVLAGLLKGKRQSSEAALKYSVYGAGAAGVMLYGISLIAGIVNSAHLPTMAVLLSYQMPAMGGEELMVLAPGGLMIAVGLAFKLSAVPFHFWCPDVFEGASAEVAGFLSVASKAGALGLLVRVAIGFGAMPADDGQIPLTSNESAPVVAMADPSEGGLFSVPDAPVDGAASVTAGDEVPPEPQATAEAKAPAETPVKEDDAAVGHAEDEHAADTHAADEHAADGHSHEAHADSTHVAAMDDGLGHVRSFMAKLIAFLAVVTCTFGNLAAYGQTNIKRLLAYSTIAHAGYMMMAVPPVLALMSAGDTAGAQDAVGALMIYIAVYLFMNLGAFAVVAFLRNAMKSEEIADYAGLIRRSPIVVICFALMLFSLVGLPPLAGFLGKFAVFAALTDAYSATGENYLMLVLVMGGINTAISLFYYLRVAATMTMSPEPEDRVPFEFSIVSMAGLFIVLITVPTLLLFVGAGYLTDLAELVARTLL